MTTENPGATDGSWVTGMLPPGEVRVAAAARAASEEQFQAQEQASQRASFRRATMTSGPAAASAGDHDQEGGGPGFKAAGLPAGPSSAGDGSDFNPKTGMWIVCPPSNKKIRDDGGAFWVPGKMHPDQARIIAQLGAERGWTQFATFRGRGTSVDPHAFNMLRACGLNCHPEPSKFGKPHEWHAAGMNTWKAIALAAVAAEVVHEIAAPAELERDLSL